MWRPRCSAITASAPRASRRAVRPLWHRLSCPTRWHWPRSDRPARHSPGARADLGRVRVHPAGDAHQQRPGGRRGCYQADDRSRPRSHRADACRDRVLTWRKVSRATGRYIPCPDFSWPPNSITVCAWPSRPRWCPIWNGTSGVQTQTFSTSIVETIRKHANAIEVAYTPGAIALHPSRFPGAGIERREHGQRDRVPGASRSMRLRVACSECRSPPTISATAGGVTSWPPTPWCSTSTRRVYRFRYPTAHGTPRISARNLIRARVEGRFGTGPVSARRGHRHARLEPDAGEASAASAASPASALPTTRCSAVDMGAFKSPTRSCAAEPGACSRITRSAAKRQTPHAGYAVCRSGTTPTGSNPAHLRPDHFKSVRFPSAIPRPDDGATKTGHRVLQQIRAQQACWSRIR